MMQGESQKKPPREGGRDDRTVKEQNRRIIDSCDDPEKILQIAKDIPELHLLNCCTAIHRLGRHPSHRFANDTRFHRIEAALETQIQDCNNMELTNTIWSYATRAIRGRSLVHKCVEVACERIHTFKPRDLAVSAWALAKLEFDKILWMPLWEAGAGDMKQYNTRDLSNLLWAFGTMNHTPSDAFFATFVECGLDRADEMTPQDLGNSLWALAILKLRNDNLLTRWCNVVLIKLAHFDQQNTSITCWSLATLEYQNAGFMHAITRYATDKVLDFVPQGLANIVWALAKWGFAQKQLLMTIAHETIRRRCKDFIPQHLSMMGWAYATLEFPNRPLLTELCEAATRAMHDFSAQHMANLTWGMATLAHKDETFLEALCRQVLRMVWQFNPQEVANLVWSFALLTWKDEVVLHAMSVRAQEIIQEFIPQNLGNTAWSFCRLQVRDDNLIRCIAKEAARTIEEFQGQDVVDLTEAFFVAPGAMEALDPADWEIIDACARKKYESLRNFFDSRPFSNVEKYRMDLKELAVMGLGYKYTTILLNGYGFLEMDSQGMQVLDEAWVEEARGLFSSATNASDASKNNHAQAGLQICRTACVFRYSVRGPNGSELITEPRVVASGPPLEETNGFCAGILRHNRAGDGEFQALTAAAKACRSLDQSIPSKCTGDLWFHVSEVCCLSCCAAMVQFSDYYPGVRLHVSYDLGRQTKTDWLRLDTSKKNLIMKPSHDTKNHAHDASHWDTSTIRGSSYAQSTTHASHQSASFSGQKRAAPEGDRHVSSTLPSSGTWKGGFDDKQAAPVRREMECDGEMIDNTSGRKRDDHTIGSERDGNINILHPTNLPTVSWGGTVCKLGAGITSDKYMGGAECIEERNWDMDTREKSSLRNLDKQLMDFNNNRAMGGRNGVGYENEEEQRIDIYPTCTWKSAEQRRTEAPWFVRVSHEAPNPHTNVPPPSSSSPGFYDQLLLSRGSHHHRMLKKNHVLDEEKFKNCCTKEEGQQRMVVWKKGGVESMDGPTIASPFVPSGVKQQNSRDYCGTPLGVPPMGPSSFPQTRDGEVPSGVKIECVVHHYEGQQKSEAKKCDIIARGMATWMIPKDSQKSGGKRYVSSPSRGLPTEECDRSGVWPCGKSMGDDIGFGTGNEDEKWIQQHHVTPGATWKSKYASTSTTTTTRNDDDRSSVDIQKHTSKCPMTSWKTPLLGVPLEDTNKTMTTSTATWK